MNFANPIWLYGLLGLAIPVFIHLWSKKEGKTIKVGSIRFFPESETRQSRRLNPNEFLLLLLRSLLVAFLVLLIAQPIMISKKKKERPTILIEPALVQDTQVAALLDTALDGDYNIKLLQAGLPDFDPDIASDADGIAYWQAIEAIERLSSNEVMIFAQNRASQFKGKLPTTSKKVTWYNIPPKDPKDMVVRAGQYEDRYHISVAHLSDASTIIENRFFSTLDELGDLEIQRTGGAVQFKAKRQQNWVTAIALMPMQIDIRYDPEFELDARLWNAAFKALWPTNAIPTRISMAETGIQSENDPDILVWLSEADHNDSQANTILKYKPDPLSANLLKGEVDGYTITRRLSLKNITSENAAEELVTTFWSDQVLDQQLDANDQRTLNTAMVEPAYSVESLLESKQTQAIPYMYWVIFMGLIGLERIVSFNRNQ